MGSLAPDFTCVFTWALTWVLNWPLTRAFGRRGA
jgi:hypothetical protein